MILIVLLTGSPVVRAADPLPYQVTLEPTGQAPLDTAAHDSMTLISLRESAPVGPFALIARARSDLGRLSAALNSFGYYTGAASITIDGRPLDDPALAAFLDAVPSGQTVPVAVKLTLGPLFHLRHVGLTGDFPAGLPDRMTLKSGAPAIAADVLAARDELLKMLLDSGHALAKVDAPAASLVPAEQALDVSFHVVAGPAVDLGPIAIDGLDRLNESYVRQRLLLHPGQPYNPADIDKARQDLASVGAVSSVRVQPADALDPDGTLPVTVIVIERPRRAVSFNAAFSTDLGGSLGASWTHRNLFGNAETLTLSAAATQLGGSASRQPGYNASAVLTFPDWLQRDQSISFNLGAVKEYLQAYDRTAVLGGITLSRKLTLDWTVSVGLAGARARITQERVTRDYTLAQVPLIVSYDSSHELFEPTHGIRASLSVTPTQSFSTPNATFVIAQANAATYVSLAAPGRTILALRGLVGGVEGATTFDIPPDQRFYGGGSSTIRGFRFQSVGPVFPDGKPTGGTSIDAGTVELRQRIGQSFGAAAFVDAGQVSSSGTPFKGKAAVGAGVGGRYFTSLGPIRLDVALPLTTVRKSDSLEVYIGLGEAF